jgi:uncharacterized NAD-dependent epimerase/dehydratase family protein|tara:strand:- start:278 stop:1306 length:1029 start_codon:yes stop_codon:yes gene_type:complete
MASFAILCPNAFDYILNKTGNMLIRYRPEDVCCVIDPITSGKTAQEILGFGGEIPVVSNFKEATEFDPNAMLIGSAPQGGFINEQYRKELKEAIQFGCDIYSGMHQFLNDDPEISVLAKKHSITINDLRRPPDPPHFSKGTWKNRKVKVLLVVGTDCDTGKMTTGWEISKRLTNQGKNVRFVATGQTGKMLSGHGVPVDAVVGDFMSGEIEHAIDHVENGADLVVVEGQGSLTNMYYSGVTLALMHGAMPDFMIMTDEPGRKKDVSGYPMSTIGQVMQLHLDLMKNFKQSQFLGINLLTLNMEEKEALHEIKELEQEHKMPVTDLIRFGDGDLINSILQSLN